MSCLQCLSRYIARNCSICLNNSQAHVISTIYVFIRHTSASREKEAILSKELMPRTMPFYHSCGFITCFFGECIISVKYFLKFPKTWWLDGIFMHTILVFVSSFKELYHTFSCNGERNSKNGVYIYHFSIGFVFCWTKQTNNNIFHKLSRKTQML